MSSPILRFEGDAAPDDADNADGRKGAGELGKGCADNGNGEYEGRNQLLTLSWKYGCEEGSLWLVGTPIESSLLPLVLGVAMG